VKKYIFAFFASFFITIVVGLFAWNLLFNSNKDIFSRVAGYIKENFFTASIAAPTTEKEQEPVLEQKKEDQQQEDNNLINESVLLNGDLVINDRQEILDDILEKIDIIKQQALELENQEKKVEAEVETKEAPKEEFVKIEETGSQTDAPVFVSGVSSRGSEAIPPRTYPKILISEAQVFPIEQRFIELYNSTSSDINLTDWYLQRKTETSDSWNSLISSTKFESKTIPAKSYFVISREGEADILLNFSLSQNNSLALKSPNGEISDKLFFGEIKEDLSFGRIWNEELQSYVDTGNSSSDFELDIPTRNAKNIKYVPLPLDETPPQINFTLDTTQTSLSFDIDFIITDPLATVTPSGLDSFVFRWKEGDNPWEEDEIEKISESQLNFSGTKNFEGENGKNYYFQIKAKDVAQNESAWLPETPVLTTVSAISPVLEKIDINTATLEQLDEIVGIGPTLAQRIIDGRPYSLLEDLLNVKGVGEVTLQKIKDQGLACVLPPEEN
jgi:competence ComEA-like helix-hairpin-helix protein